LTNGAKYKDIKIKKKQNSKLKFKHALISMVFGTPCTAAIGDFLHGAE
jgi:hypothetical protein